eukprot:TRINITY_DN9591_c0_g1_i1.p1 TRINITY_DN9591_c0_g1~~TRINITY_DN9591_c0_g1_i1.p1  ORF type:complete len:270 (-),score=58.15 TRINITY_DN9591_c0_g1_i1:7-816(-)
MSETGLPARVADAPTTAPNAPRRWFRKKITPLGDPAIYEPHQGEGRQYLRDMILGVNDGLVSMLLLVIGVYGGGLTTKGVLLTGITGAVAGAISMALGEYIATKSQRELYEGDRRLEQVHFSHHRQIEENEVRDILGTLNFSGQLLEDSVKTISASDEALMKFMMAFEFGQNEQDIRSPFRAMITSGLLFIGGSLPSVIPFACTSNRASALYAAIVLCAVAAFSVGAIKTMATRGNWLFSGFENLTLGAIGAAISYGIGQAYNSGVGTA